MIPLISVCIYTYNRAKLLAQVLESLREQALPLEQFEVIVVDNCSTDDTRLLVENFTGRLPNLFYRYEARAGSAYARNTGWKAARTDYVAFIDDDGKASPEWLQVAMRIIKDYSPDMFGGPIYPYYQSSKPEWFKDDYGTYDTKGMARWLCSQDEYLYGSNLFARRSIMEDVGGFDVRLGMKGSRIGYGEETMLIRSIRLHSPAARIYYDPELVTYHLVRPEKMRFTWQVRNRFAQGRDGYLTFSDGVHRLEPRHILGFLALPLVIAYEGSLGVLMRDRAAYPYPQNYYFERVLQRVATWGKLYERLRCTLGAGGNTDG